MIILHVHVHPITSKHVRIVSSEAPTNVTYSVTSRSVTIIWNNIDCIERNGEITNYIVVFQEWDGATISGEVDMMNRTFTASELTPHTNYTFRVAGVNINGTGPFSDNTIISTAEDGNLFLWAPQNAHFH